MKRFLFAVLLVVAFLPVSAGNGYTVNYSEPESGSYQLDFQLAGYDLEQVVLNGNTFTKIIFEGSVFTEKKGFAKLPYIHAAVQLPADRNVSLKITGESYTDIQLSAPLVPSRGVIYRNQDPSAIPYVIAPSSLRDEWYPQSLAVSSSPYILRDIRGTNVYVYPFRYNAVTQVLRVYESVTVELIENDTPAINPLPSQPDHILAEMDAVYRSVFVNYNPVSDDLTIGEIGDILVVCTSRDEDAMGPWVEWKRQKGYNVETLTVPTGTNIVQDVQNAYDNNNNLLYVLLVGDWADIKSDVLSGSAPMDPQVGCVVGSDEVPDITVGRFSANSADQVTVQVNKVIQYEKYPDMSGSWYTSALGVASNQGPGDDNELDYEHIDNIWNNKLDPYTYENFSSAYDPTGTAQMVASAINSGVAIINYCGHGSETSWGSTGFSNSHIANLTNGDKLPIIFSVACVNGAFTGNSDCFAEAWLKKENGGAVATVMSTINQPWDPPMRGEDYFDDILTGGYDYSQYPGQNGITTDELRTTIGSIVFNGLVLMTTESSGSSDWETAKTWHLFGDPSMQVRTDVPGDMNLSNSTVLSGAPFVTTVTGPNGPVEGALICLSQDGEYYRGFSDASGTVTINHTLVPGTAQMVVTAYNMETIAEEVTVVPPGGPYVIVNETSVDDASGNGNGQADYGETVMLNVAAENVGTDPATSVSATLATTDPYVTITDDSFVYGDIPAGSVIEGNDAFEITIDTQVPDNYSALFEIAFSDGSDAVWISNFAVTLHAPVVGLDGYSVMDPTGNNNGKIDPGETVDIEVTLINDGSSDGYNLTAELASADPFVTIDVGSQTVGDVAAGGTGVCTFTITADPTTPAGHMASFTVSWTGDLDLAGEEEFTEVIGQIPVLILDLDGNSNSAPGMEEALADIDMAYESLSAFPDDLSLYSTIFVCLGIYPDNHVLSTDEGQQLADYLNNGGNLYMEGGDTWYYDEQTAVHAMFGITPVSDGSSDLSTVIGLSGTFTEGMSFAYSGDNNWIDKIAPNGNAFAILDNMTPSYTTAVANDAGSYRTIGASHEFGGLTDGASPSTKAELMQAYLEFFGFNTLQAMFTSNVTEICEGDIVEFYDNSIGDIVSWEWTFEGGTPGSSSYQNPQVYYPYAGTYDVTLSVSNGNETSTITLEDYITVNICTGLDDRNEEVLSVFPNPGSGMFHLTWNGSEIPENIVITDLLGNTVLTVSGDKLGVGTIELDLTSQEAGVYFVVANSKDGKLVKRLIVR
ncbi:MAG: hypothetical protein Kow00127_13490 [Bacteroidales bacterium]